MASPHALRIIKEAFRPRTTHIGNALGIERELVQVMVSVLSNKDASGLEKVSITGEYANAIRRTNTAIAKLKSQKLLKELLPK
jgi:hypothetical protein